MTLARRNIGMVFQKANPFPAMSRPETAGVKASRPEKDFRVEDSLRKASLWEEVKDRLPRVHPPSNGFAYWISDYGPAGAGAANTI